MAKRGQIFKQVSMKKHQRNTFDLSHDKKLSMNMGKLVPTMLVECLPGDTMSGAQQSLVRFAPMLAPVMHKVKVYTHYFFVPNRLVWDNWEDFITGGEDGLQEPVWPYMGVGNGQLEGYSTIFDYMGLPYYDEAGTTQVSAIPFAMYNLIFNEYYRDQNLQTGPNYELDYKLEDGANNTFRDSLKLMNRAWPHDYFSSALPWQQKGPQATIPLGTSAPLEIFDPSPLNPNHFYWSDLDKNAWNNSGNLQIQDTGVTQHATEGTGFSDVTQYTRADLTGATAASIVDLRRAFRLQEWLEKNARGGSRYTESIYVHFGVKSPDARLQRPEYIGGGVQSVSFSEVLNTTGAVDDPTGGSDIEFLPQGNMSGHGITAGNNGTFKYFVQEHGYIMGITSIIPDTGYQQGIPAHFLRRDRFDYYWKQFAHIGEQPIENQEIYVSNDGENQETFGYKPRYAEYRYIPNTVHGDMRESLQYWHLGRYFDNRPQLNGEFIECIPSNRIFAVETGPEGEEIDHIWMYIHNSVTGKRQIPLFGNPMM
jgi:hypothetical protein